MALSPRLDSPHKAKWGKAGFPLMVVPTVGAVRGESPLPGTHPRAFQVPVGGPRLEGGVEIGFTTQPFRLLVKCVTFPWCHGHPIHIVDGKSWHGCGQHFAGGPPAPGLQFAL